VTSRKEELLPSLAVATCGIGWGATWLPLRSVNDLGLGSCWVCLLLSLFAVLVPLPSLLLRPPTAREIKGQVITGLLMGLGFTLYVLSLSLTDVLHSILLFYLTPIWSTLIAVLIYHQPLTLPRGLAIVAGVVGMALVLGWNSGFPIPRGLGDWMALSSGVLWAIATTRSHHLPAKLIALPALMFGLGCLLTSAAAFVIALYVGSPLAQAAGLFDALPWVALLAITVFVPPNFLILWAVQRLDSGRLGILLMTEVLVGTITAALFSGTALAYTEIVGTALIILAGLIEILGNGHTRRA
jgi:drug/metabolite transporter (DMT)-like permease